MTQYAICEKAKYLISEAFTYEQIILPVSDTIQKVPQSQSQPNSRPQSQPNSEPNSPPVIIIFYLY